jgi:hypothetical protein
VLSAIDVGRRDGFPALLALGDLRLLPHILKRWSWCKVDLGQPSLDSSRP